MDSVTHLILGAAVGEAMLGRQLGKRAMLWGALANSYPDIDVFFTPLFEEPYTLRVHRGLTHSLIFCIGSSFILAWLFSRFRFKRQAPFRSWLWFFLTAIHLHIIIDSFTAYGTGWFEPFSDYRVSFNNIFVADPFYSLPLLVTVTALLFIRGTPVEGTVPVIKAESVRRRRRKWNRAGLIISSSYLVFTFVNKAHVNSVFKTSLQDQQQTYSRLMTTPTPLNNFLWMGIAEQPDGFLIGYYSDFDSDKNVKFTHVPRNEELLNRETDTLMLQTLKWFSNGYYCVTETDSSICYNDLRFGQVSGWDDPEAPFAYVFDMSKKDSRKALDRGRVKGSMGDNLRILVKRIKGN